MHFHFIPISSDNVRKRTKNVPIFLRDRREEIDPADYCFENLDGVKKGKFPGQISGQQFGIENCKVSYIRHVLVTNS